MKTLSKYLVPIFFLMITISSFVFSSCEKEVNEENLFDKKWILNEMETDTANISPVKEIFIEFSDSTITGSGGCNGYWINDYILEGNEFNVNSIISTDIYCGKQISGIEETYFKVLRSAEKIKIVGNKLEISGTLGELEYKK